MFDRYKYVVTPTKIIAISTYAGQTVRGVAKCHPNDTFDEEFGKTLAAARCDVKVAQRRLRNAQKREEEAYEKCLAAEKQLDRMSEYVDDANYELSLAEIFLNTLLDNEKADKEVTEIPLYHGETGEPIGSLVFTQGNSGVETNGSRAAFIEKESMKAESSWWKKFWNWLINN